MADQLYFPSIPAKKLKTDILSTDSTFKLRDIKWYTGSDSADVSLSSSIFGPANVGYGVFEPNTPRQEFFTFNPTNMAVATTTGLTIVARGLPWGSDYTTEATARKFNHASGSAVLLMTNAPALYDKFANKTNDESITGVWTFTQASAMPRLDASHTYGAGEEEYLATKRYVDGVVTGGAADANTTTKGLAEEATQAEIAAGTAAGGTAARLFANPSTLAAHAQAGTWHYAVEDGTGADDTYTATLTPTLAAYTTGMVVVAKFTVANTGAATFNIDARGAIAVKKYVAGAIADIETGDIVANQPCILEYDSVLAAWVLLNPGATTLTTAIAQEVATFFGATDITGTEAETLTAGTTSDADTKHTHNKIPSGHTLVMFQSSPQLGAAGTGCGYSQEGTTEIITVANADGVYMRCQVAKDAGLAVYPITTSNATIDTVLANMLYADAHIWSSVQGGGITARQDGSSMTFASQACSGAMAWDETSTYMMFLNTTTNVRRFTYAATTFTFVDNITLANAVTIDRGWVFDDTNNMMYFIDETNNVIRKFNTSGTQQSATAYTIDDTNSKGLVALNGRIYICINGGLGGSDASAEPDISANVFTLVPTTVTF